MITGVILAGGQNRRMGGRVKALLDMQGEPLLSRQLVEMSQICEDIIVVTNTPEILEGVIAGFTLADVSCIPDRFPGQGPLSGMHAACLASTGSQLWVVGCDMPFISAEAAIVMGNLGQETQTDAVIPVIQGKVQPLHGVYDKRIGTIIEQCLIENKPKLMGLLEQIRWEAAEEEFFLNHHIGLQFAANVNTPNDYDKLLQGYVK
jgi:molybdopterin-guanine dinucleotide biosynthesis protein A